MNMNVSFLYCVAKYPTDPKDLNLNFFTHLKTLYKEKIKGFSSHEMPEKIICKFAMGATIFEKHVGIETKKYKLNQY